MRALDDAADGDVLLVVVLLALAVGSGTIVTLVVRKWPATDPGLPGGATRAVAHEIDDRIEAPSFTRSRLDPQRATGLALTVAFAIVLLGGLVAGVVTFMVRTDTGLARADRSVALWGADHATDFSTTVLKAVTNLGTGYVVVGIVALVAVFEYRRLRNGAIVPFLVVVLGGETIVANLVKVIVDRVRPDIHQLAGFSGASFPSGHATTAAACFAAFALLAGRGRSPRAHAWLAGAAVGIAIAVATTRVLLGVHWMTDVIAGLAIGWAWFALAAVAFGGRLLHFGAPAEIVARAEGGREEASITPD